MSSNAGKKFGPLSFFLAAMIAVGGWLIYNRYQRTYEFPGLPVGAYVGHISLDDVEPAKHATLYLERFPNTSIFVAVVFDEGFKPQAILAEQNDSASATKESLKPIKLSWNDRSFLLMGRSEGTKANGVLVANADAIGSWELKGVSSADLVGSTLSLPNGADLVPWLEQKSFLRALRRELREKEERLAQSRERKKKLEEFVSNEPLLKQRSAERRDALAQELQKATGERKETAKILAGFVADLEQISRVTRTGQAVLLARRVATREDRWYLANWNVGENSSAIEESMALASGLDTNKLEESLKRANEIKSLLRDIDNEKAQIRKLQEQGSAGAPSNSENVPKDEGVPPKPAPESGGEEKPNLWDRIFG